MHSFDSKLNRSNAAVPRRTKSAPYTAANIKHIKQSYIRNILGNSTIQTKLTIGAKNDKYEHEEDAMAAKVMRMPDQRDENN